MPIITISKMKRLGHILSGSAEWVRRRFPRGRTMLMNLDPTWMMMAFAVVAILSFIFGMALDGLLGDEGFGPVGNTIVVTAGFFLGIFAANLYGIRFYDMKMAVATGLVGAFVSLGILAMVKAGLARL
jgi:hypothetical protein